MSKIDFGDVALVGGIAAFIVGLFYFIIAGVGAIDEEYFDKIDNTDTCFVRTVEVNNWWLTPGESSETRTTYCKKSD